MYRLCTFIHLAPMSDEVHNDLVRFSVVCIEHSIIPNTQLEHAFPRSYEWFWPDQLYIFSQPS